MVEISVDEFYEDLKKEIERSGYHFNEDTKFVKELLEGILTNRERYGYDACPCRLAIGIKERDLDLICPCDYRDMDLDEYGACFCALYVTKETIATGEEVKSIPDRRLETLKQAGNIKYPVWRCEVCGYTTARNKAPESCPTCYVDREQFFEVEDPENDLSSPTWRCKVCGCLISEDEAPDKCPVCFVEKERFEKYL